MGMITSVRAPLPIGELPRQRDLAVPDRTPRADRGTAAVTGTEQPVAQHPALGVTAGSESARLSLRNTTETIAADAAEAARKAYIKASLAAGLNPLPLP